MTQMVTPTSFKARLPEFAATTNSKIQQYIDESVPFFNIGPRGWGDLLDLGVTFWVAHCMTVDVENATSPQIDDSVMKKVGDIAKSRSEKLVEAEANNDYLRTKYGTKYIMYRNMVSRGGMAV